MNFGDHALTVIRMQLVEPKLRVTRPFFGDEADHLLDLRAVVERAAGIVQRGDVRGCRNLFDQGAIAGLALL
jgi:hypothetical protein